MSIFYIIKEEKERTEILRDYIIEIKDLLKTFMRKLDDIIKSEVDVNGRKNICCDINYYSEEIGFLYTETENIYTKDYNFYIGLDLVIKHYTNDKKINYTNVYKFLVNSLNVFDKNYKKFKYNPFVVYKSSKFNNGIRFKI